jgi:hypothetical protein
MRWPVALTFGLALLAASGCRSACRTDRLESELRTRETDLREAREELERSQAFNRALQTEVEALRGGSCLPPGSAEHAPFPVYPVRAIVLGRQTGGYDTGHCPGDDALQVILEPRDPDGQAIKAPGSLVVQVLEINAEGLKRPLSTWQIAPEQLRRTWRNGLLASGYQLVLPWKIWPSTEKLRIVTQFRLADGRTFEADKDVTIRLTPVARRPPPPPDSLDYSEPPDGILPPPRKLEPGQVGEPNEAKSSPARRNESGEPRVVWRKANPVPLVPAAQILRPVPLEERP